MIAEGFGEKACRAEAYAFLLGLYCIEFVDVLKVRYSPVVSSCFAPEC